MSTKYQKFGLRADRNLTDLDNRNEALANMLEGLAVDDNGYVPGDLTVINGLRNTDVTSSDLIQAGDDNTIVTYTPLDEPGVNRPVQPIVRIVDRIENYKIITGTPNFVNGGDGPNAWFIPSSGLNTPSKTTTGADIVNKNVDGVIGPVDFWDNGTFAFGIKINDEFDDTYGGVQWEGYTSLTRFSIETTGLYMIEADPYGQGYETIRNVYAEVRDVTYTSTGVSEGKTFIVIEESDLKYVNIGDYIVQGFNKIVVEKIEGTTLTFDSEITGLAASGTINLEFEMSGEDSILSPVINLRTSFTGDVQKIRITVWWNDRGDGDRLPNKNFEFYDIDSERYPFSYFYKEYPYSNNPAPYTYQEFAEKKASPTAQRSDVVLSTTDTIAIQYVPPVDVSTKLKTKGRTFTFDGKGKLFGSIDNLEVGDYLVGPTYAYQVFQITPASTNVPSHVFVNADTFSAKNASAAIGDTFTFDIVSHLGLIDIYNTDITTGLGTTVTPSLIGNSAFETRADYLVAGDDNTKFKRITVASDYNGVNDSITAVSIHGESETFDNSNYVMVYASTGLQDLSSEAQCQGVVGKEAKGTSSGTQLIVTDSQGLTTGMYVQFLTNTTSPNRTATSTRVSAIGTTTITENGQQVTYALITLDKNILGTIESGATIVFSPVSTNKEYCILPLNTAPPFAGTTAGLATTSAFPNIKFEGVKFTNLVLNGVTAQTNTDFSVSERLTITHNGTQYRMLIK